MAQAAEFPTTFTNEMHVVHPYHVAAKHAQPFVDLANKGYEVAVGLRREDVSGLADIAQQPGTREYCPKDLTARWGTEELAEKQLTKDGGRGVLRLVSRDTGQIMGFGWTGRMSQEEQALLPGCENTFALRLHEDSRGQKLGTPFSKAIVAASMVIFKARNIGLETWASNTPAVRTYLGAQAVLVTTVDSQRPTLQTGPHTHLNEGVRSRADVRLYMKYPWSAR